MTSLVVAEVFGPTWQGEGPSAGRRASFVRLAGCNLTCTWCDSAFTWDASRYDLRAESRRIPVADILAQVAANNTGLTVITGGEPLLHQGQPGWEELLAGLARLGAIEVETNGTIAPTDATLARVGRYAVSPKLSNSGGAHADRIRPGVLRGLHGTGRAIFKFVVVRPGDLGEIGMITRQAGIPPSAVWVMPEGQTAEVVLARHRAIAEYALEAGYNTTTRLHVLLWGQERAR